jgi:hypothetical protein
MAARAAALICGLFVRFLIWFPALALRLWFSFLILAALRPARLWDHGLIDPRDSRRVLALTLAICREAEMRETRPNTFGVVQL